MILVNIRFNSDMIMIRMVFPFTGKLIDNGGPCNSQAGTSSFVSIAFKHLHSEKS